MERFLKSCLPDGKFNVSPARSRAMSSVRGKGNKSTELRLQMALVRHGIRGWKTQRSDLPGKPDLFFASHKLAVFVDGCFWHGCSKCGHIPKTNQLFWAAKIHRNRQRHRKVANVLRQMGIRTMRFWEHQLKMGLPGCVSRIRKALS